MLGAFINFVVLYCLIEFFERSRDDLGSFQIGLVAFGPILIVVVIRVVLGLLYPQPMYPQPILMMVLPPLALIGVTFFLLYKHLEIPLGRSIGYTVAVVVVNEVLALLFLTARHVQPPLG